MKAMSRIAAAMPFAQLLGLSKKADDDEKEKQKKARGAEDDASAEEEEGEDEAARAEEDDGGSDDGDMASEHAEEEDGDDGDGKEKEKGKGKSRKTKSKGEAAEDKDEEGDDDEKSARSAVRRDRARTAEIIAHGQATGRIHQATAAARYGISVKVAKAILDAGDFDQPGARTETLADRMAASNVTNVEAETPSKTPTGITKTAAAIIAAGKKADEARKQQ